MEKKSYFDLDRRLMEEEWEELSLWRKENPELRWRQSNPHPTNPDLVFNCYNKFYKNGEQWITVEKRKRNRERENKWRREWNAAHPEERKEQMKRSRDNNIDSYKQREKEQRDKGRVLRRKLKIGWVKRRVARDPLYKLRKSISLTINTGFRSRGFSKSRRASQEILGIDMQGFRDYIESQFEPWMTWENYGGGAQTEPNVRWEFDHRIPMATAKTEEEVLKLNHYTNFQPLCVFVNRNIKRDNLDWRNG